MKVYHGTVNEPGEWQVSVKDLFTGVTAPLPHHVQHSPDGFAWGYAGSGPTELARCLLLDVGLDDPSPALVLRFCRAVIEPLDKERGFTLAENSILSWLRNVPDEV